MIFGIVRSKQTTGSLLRNWITFMLRELIMQERLAYHVSTKPNIQKVMQKFIQYLNSEIQMKVFRYENEHRLAFFEQIITYKNILCRKTNDGEYEALL